jgi:hypothetical protein
MKLKAPPYGEILVTSSVEAARVLDNRELAAFAEAWPELWPTYHEVLQGLFSDYDHEDLFAKKQTRLLLEKLVPNKKVNEGADLLLRFSFDDTDITWDIFQKGREIVHAQPVF